MNASPGRIVVLSDTHLGRPKGSAGSPAMLRPLWQGARTLVINGDLAEIHDKTHRAASARQVLELQTMCEDDGVELVLIAGNHDPFISDRRYLSLFNDEVYLTHGDVLHPAISPWAKHAPELRQLHEEAIQIADTAAAAGIATLDDLRHQAAKYASHFEWDHIAEHPIVKPSFFERRGGLPRKVCLALYYWTLLPRMAAGYARFHAPKSRFFIFGHIHRAGVWNAGDRLIINTGSYGAPGKPRGVIIGDGNLTVQAIEPAGDTWRWGTKCYGVFPVVQAGGAARAPRYPREIAA